MLLPIQGLESYIVQLMFMQVNTAMRFNQRV